MRSKLKKVDGKWTRLYKITRKKYVTERNCFGIKRKKLKWVTEWVDWETYKKWKTKGDRPYEYWAGMF